MILAYLDESGNTGADLTDESQPFHYVGALLVPEGAWSTTKAAIGTIVEFATASGYEGDASHCELHGKEILQGNRGWRGVSITNRLAIFSRCLDVMETHDLQMVRGGCNKRLLRERDVKTHHPHSIALWLCLERVALVARRTGQLAVMIADDCGSSHKELSRQTLLRYRRDGAPFGSTVDFSCLVEVIHFMPSHDSPHIQVCDVAMYIQQRYARTKDTRLEDLYYRCNRRAGAPPGLMPY